MQLMSLKTKLQVPQRFLACDTPLCDWLYKLHGKFNLFLLSQKSKLHVTWVVQLAHSGTFKNFIQLENSWMSLNLFLIILPDACLFYLRCSTFNIMKNYYERFTIFVDSQHYELLCKSQYSLYEYKLRKK